MKRIHHIFLGISMIFSLLVCSCGDGSEKLQPSEPYKNFFEADPADKSATAELRRDFYNNTGIYLIFSDLLGTYTDEFGIERTEMVDFNWALTDNDSFSYYFDEVADEDKQHATDMVAKYFLPYINIEGSKLKPYSILLVSNLNSNQKDTYDDPSPVDYMSCWRCFAINVDEWIEADEEGAKTLGKNLLYQLVSTKIDYQTPELEPFFAVCEEHYDNYYIVDSFPEWMDEQDIEIIYEAGFRKYYADWYGEADYDAFYSKRNDLADFMKAVFDEDEADFMDKWGDYPKIVEKYNILKGCIETLGIDFNAVK